MTASVTSIARARTVARSKAAIHETNGRITFLTVFVVAVLVVIGLGATLSASSVVGLMSEQHDGWFFFKRQILAVAAGVIAMLVAARIPYLWYRKWALPLFVVGVAGLVAVLAIGELRNGSRRWISLGFTEFQPSELAKFSTIVALAAVMEKKQRLLDDFGHFLAPVLATIGLVGVLIMLQPDLGTTLIICAAGFGVLAVSATPVRFLALAAGSGVLLATVLAYAADYRESRLAGFLNPEADPLGAGYQALQSLGALGTGGAFGVGLGASRTRWGWVPNAHTDFIFAIIGEEVGFAGAILIIGLFALLAILGFVIAQRAPDRFGRMLATGITVWLAAQALVNIGGVVQALPITGMPLPFVSFGGTAIVVSMAAVGVLVNIGRRGVAPSRRRKQ